MSRETTSTTVEVLAFCDGCDWTSDAVNAMGNAARHHDASGHCVVVDITRRVTYGRQQTPEERGNARDGIYQCSFCGKWHRTHKVSKSSKRKAAKQRTARRKGRL